MPRANYKTAKVRTNVVLSQDIADVLDTIAKETGNTKTAVIRQAIALIKLAHEEKKKGRHLGFTDSSDKLDTEIYGAF